MVLLENVDLKELDLYKIRKFNNCPCELCDDGCFDRTKQVHSATCKKTLENENKKVFSLNQRENTTLTHYKDTFKPHFDARPSTAYRPPLNKFDYVPRGNMDLNTTQKTTFKPPPLNIEKQKAFKFTDTYELPKEPFNGQTSYRSEFIPREMVFSGIVKRSGTTIKKATNEKISSNTTSKEHFRNWQINRSSCNLTGEYPSYAGEALFPNGDRSFSTTTNAIHQAPIYSTKEDLVAKLPEKKDCIRLEGDIDLLTNYRDTFKKHENAERTKIIAPTQSTSIIADKKPMIGETQNKSDFKFHFDHQPPKLAACNPYISDLDKQILYPGNCHDHNTIYASEYKGHDPRENPKPKSFNPEKMTYERPTEKLETETVSMRDFKPIDLSKIPFLKAKKITGKLRIPAGPMETLTMSKIQFVPYKISAPNLAKDPNPYYYVPPKERFNAQTTNMQTYLGTKGLKAVSCKPDFNNIESSGEIDFNTMYKNDFIKHGLSLCEAKAYFIAKMKNDKNAVTSTSSIGSQSTVS